MEKKMVKLSVAIVFIAVMAVGNPGAVISSIASSSTVVGEATQVDPFDCRYNEIEDRQGPAEKTEIASASEERIVFAKTDSDAETETGTVAA